MVVDKVARQGFELGGGLYGNRSTRVGEWLCCSFVCGAVNLSVPLYFFSRPYLVCGRTATIFAEWPDSVCRNGWIYQLSALFADQVTTVHFREQIFH